MLEPPGHNQVIGRLGKDEPQLSHKLAVGLKVHCFTFLGLRSLIWGSSAASPDPKRRMIDKLKSGSKGMWLSAPEVVQTWDLGLNPGPTVTKSHILSGIRFLISKVRVTTPTSQHCYNTYVAECKQNPWHVTKRAIAATSGGSCC